MENSAISRICTQKQVDQDHSSWTSSMDDLLLFDHSKTISYHFQNAAVFSSSDDDDLQDTATSPPHPSIISDMDGLSSKQKKQLQQQQLSAMINQTKHKGKEIEEFGEVEDRIEVGFVGRDNNCSTGLKNIGLCLVPVSMAINYFG
ncbi:uncharacterized protein LOC111446888 [Cucurbita moschata]|uniref:Uncharacterized protein LOC111446888 n=1 Tax=Cucurbita moschata TaxID=3662 RepID=A0A6J1FU25_CUCMO|nr:uncharacterized protein LOC111446888 [Cucurbita moschata]